MVTVPSARAVANPLKVIDATLLFEDCHCATFVMSWVVLSENVPIAVYCWLNPRVKLELAEFTAIPVTVADVTVSKVLPLTDPRVALMVAEPAESAELRPFVGAVVLIVATDVFEEAQVTCVVRFCVLLSL